MQRSVAEALAHNSDVQPARHHAAPPHGGPATTPRGTPQPSRVAKRFDTSADCTMRSCKVKRFDTTTTRRRPLLPRHPAAAGKAATRPSRGGSMQHRVVGATRRGRGGASQPRGEKAQRGAHAHGAAWGAGRCHAGAPLHGSPRHRQPPLIPPFPVFRAARGGPPCATAKVRPPCPAAVSSATTHEKVGKEGSVRAAGALWHGPPVPPAAAFRCLSVAPLRVFLAAAPRRRPVHHQPPPIPTAPATSGHRMQPPCHTAPVRRVPRAWQICKTNNCASRGSVIK